MKKRYVIMAASLSNMGGAQMYIRNKMLYLRSHGWDVTITAAITYNIVIPELREFKNVIPELQYFKYYYRKGIQKRITEELCRIVADKEYDEIVIESTTITQSSWAESVAKKTGARHIIYLLQEQNVLKNKGLQCFFQFKHSRHELVGIAEQSLTDMFKSFYSLRPEESYCLPAYCNNVVEDIDFPFLESIDRCRYDYVIGAFSRLDKPYVLFAVDDICQYAASNHDKSFLFIWIGDAPAGSSVPDQVKQKVAKQSNIELLLTGYLMPVPKRLLEMCDVVISSSGSAWVGKRSGVPTIPYDGNDYQPIGVLGRTTTHALFRGYDEPPQNLCNLLDQILFEKRYPKMPSEFVFDLPDFKSHIDFLNNTVTQLEYFNMDTLHLETKSEKKVALGLFVVGPRGYTKLHQSREKELLII